MSQDASSSNAQRLFWPVKVRELIKELEKADWVHVRTKGDLRVFRHADGRITVVSGSWAMTCSRARIRRFLKQTTNERGLLREFVREYIPDDFVYDETFDWFEYILALIYCDQTTSSQDLAALKATGGSIDLKRGFDAQLVKISAGDL